MPRSHYPVKGGARLQPRPGAAMAPDAAGDCGGCKEKNSEIDRLRQELARARLEGPGGRAARPAAMAIVWAALGVCGIGMLFALAAILHHG